MESIAIGLTPEERAAAVSNQGIDLVLITRATLSGLAYWVKNYAAHIPRADEVARDIVQSQAYLDLYANELSGMKARIAELEKLVALTDSIVESRTTVLEAIPECPLHGNTCIPHAIEWVEQAKASNIDFESEMKRMRQG